jgi:hypothetical protein
MLAHHDPLARRQMQRDDVTRRVAAEGELTGRLGLEHQQGHAAERPSLQPFLERMQPDLHVGVVPQQDVMLEVDRHLPVERHVQDGDWLPLQAVGEAGSGALADLGGKYLRRGGHGWSLSIVVWGGTVPR